MITAVELLQEYLTLSLGKDRMRLLENEFNKAKQMEKEQIITTWYECKLSIIDKKPTTADEYYFKKFNK